MGFPRHCPCSTECDSAPPPPSSIGRDAANLILGGLDGGGHVNEDVFEDVDENLKGVSGRPQHHVAEEDRHCRVRST